MQSKLRTVLVLMLGAVGVVACGGGGGGGAGGGGAAPVPLAQMGGARQGAVLNLVPTVSTLAGTNDRAADGVGAAARFTYSSATVSDGTNLYVADTGNQKIRKIVIATGAVSSLTGLANTAGVAGSADGSGTTATFNGPQGIVTDGTSLYVADTGNQKIRKIVLATGEVSSLTGAANSQGGTGFVDGTGTMATFNTPTGITSDGTHLYVSDTWNHKIRKIVMATGEVAA